MVLDRGEPGNHSNNNPIRGDAEFPKKPRTLGFPKRLERTLFNEIRDHLDSTGRNAIPLFDQPGHRRTVGYDAVGKPVRNPVGESQARARE